MLGEKPPARYWPEASRRFSEYYSKQAWINVQKLMFVAEKEGREEAGKTTYKKLPKYKLSRSEKYADTGNDVAFVGHPLDCQGWGGGVGCWAGHNGVGCAH